MDCWCEGMRRQGKKSGRFWTDFGELLGRKGGVAGLAGGAVVARGEAGARGGSGRGVAEVVLNREGREGREVFWSAAACRRFAVGRGLPRVAGAFLGSCDRSQKAPATPRMEQAPSAARKAAILAALQRLRLAGLPPSPSGATADMCPGGGGGCVGVVVLFFSSFFTPGARPGGIARPDDKLFGYNSASLSLGMKGNGQECPCSISVK